MSSSFTDFCSCLSGFGSSAGIKAIEVENPSDGKFFCVGCTAGKLTLLIVGGTSVLLTIGACVFFRALVSLP